MSGSSLAKPGENVNEFAGCVSGGPRAVDPVGAVGWVDSANALATRKPTAMVAMELGAKPY